MGIFIIAIVAILIGVFLIYKYRDDYNEGPLILGFILGIPGLIALIICFIQLINTRIDDTNYLIEYQNDKLYIESNYNNENLTDNERMKLSQIIMTDNNIITKSKTWRNNFWIGCFYPYRVGDLKLFDAKKIKSAKLKIDIGK